MKKLSILLLTCIYIFLIFPSAAESPKEIKLIFEYKIKSNWSTAGEESGFYISLYDNGLISIKTPICLEDRNVNENWISIGKEYADEILATIKETDISDIPNSLNNGSLDGSSNNFYFNGKDIHSDNIGCVDISPKAIKKYEYSQETITNAQYENRVIELFDKISQIFHRAGYKLTLYGFELD